MIENILCICITTGSNKGKRLRLSLIECKSDDDDISTPGFRRTQFPIRVRLILTAGIVRGQSFSGAPDLSFFVMRVYGKNNSE